MTHFLSRTCRIELFRGVCKVLPLMSFACHCTFVFDGGLASASTQSTFLIQQPTRTLQMILSFQN